MGLYGAVEAGGTKFVCAVGTGPTDLRSLQSFSTRSPEETVRSIIEFFRRQAEPLTAIGIGSFGPLDLDPKSSTYGMITSTPKPDWQNIRLYELLHTALRFPIMIDTDTNAAALGEYCWGAGRGIDNFVYMTIGTGIGGGAMVDGRLVHGLIHPEIGHMRIPHDTSVDPFAGVCPAHGDCLEGLASGVALEQRSGRRASELSDNDALWSLEAKYLALGLVNLIVTLSPMRIILGGGVMRRERLFALVRRDVQVMLNDYLRTPLIREHIAEYIVPPALGDRSGVLGAIALARSSTTITSP